MGGKSEGHLWGETSASKGIAEERHEGAAGRQGINLRPRTGKSGGTNG